MCLGPSSQGYGFSSGHVWMQELECEESWVPKNWWCWTVVLEKTLESLLDCEEIQPVNPKGIGPETPILWLPDAKNWLIGKDPGARKDWRWKEKGMTEDKMIGWHHWLNGHEFEQALGVGEGLGNLAYCSPWGRKELDMTEQLNINNKFLVIWNFGGKNGRIAFIFLKISVIQRNY